MMNMRDGPDGPGVFQPDQMVTCDYVNVRMGGASRKFHCAIAQDDVVKVRYGMHNREVQGSVLATRLLWSLGFVANRVYPVRVRCRGCSVDPWHQREPTSGVHDFDPAVIERHPRGSEMRVGSKKAGWSWPELELVEEDQGGAPRAHRDALKLLAVFMQHTDTKPQQQRLLCPPGMFAATGECRQPFMMLHDVGLTFGHANAFNRANTGSVNLEEWADAPIWSDAAKCVGHLSRSNTGTLGNPVVGEAGRKFLADLLLQLTDRQLQDLFEAAHLQNRNPRSDGFASRGDQVAGWVAAFKHKRDEIARARCPSA